MKSASSFMLGVIAVSIIGCGSRTDIDTVDVGHSTPAATTPPVIDQCPSAILAGAPKAMTGNCSTRDGRSRVAAPRAPHIRWTTQVPIAGGTGDSLEMTGFVTDAAGNAFLSSFDGLGSAPVLRKFDSKGNVSWATDFAQGPTPFLTAKDSLLVFGGPPVAVSSVDLLSGAASQLGTFGFDHHNYLDPAIGRDGSIYFVHEIDGSAGNLAVSRANVDGTIAWTSETWSTPAGEAVDTDDVSEVALGNDDMVFVAASARGDALIVYAFDASTGKSAWTQRLEGYSSADVRVRPDGSLVVSPSVQLSNLTVLSPTGEVLYDWRSGFAEVVAVAVNGDLLLSGGPGLVATGADGTVLWNKDSIMVADATITNDGIVIAADTAFGHRAITALDFSSGNILWTIPAPSANSCMLGMTLTSDSTVIGVQCDGTVFGASD